MLELPGYNVDTVVVIVESAISRIDRDHLSARLMGICIES